MRKAKYIWGTNIDEAAKVHIIKQKAEMLEKEDDRLYFVVGKTGAGKSMLVFNLLEIYTNNLTMDFVVQERSLFAAALKKVKDLYLIGERELYLWFDEADTDNLEQQARWNKRLFSMYMKLRKLGILHFWCYPSLKSIDRRFIEEKVSGVYLCYDKAKNRPRNYIYFKKEAILHMMDLDIRLTLPNMYKYRKKFGKYMGYYKDYKGPLREAYDSKKVNSMSNSVDEFAEEFDGTAPKKIKGNNKAREEMERDDVYTPMTIARSLGVGENTIRNRIRNAMTRGLISPQSTSNGRISLTKEEAELVSKRFQRVRGVV